MGATWLRRLPATVIVMAMLALVRPARADDTDLGVALVGLAGATVVAPSGAMVR